MKANVRAAPPHAVVLLSAPGHGRPPDTMDGTVIAATEDCVAIGCQPDGDTEFVLGDLLSVGQDGMPAFQGRFRADGAIALQTVEGVTLLEHPVPTAWADVWIWLNHPTEPDLVVVGVVCVMGLGLTTSIVAFRLLVEDGWPPVEVERFLASQSAKASGFSPRPCS